jgi:hypothetical protein
VKVIIVDSVDSLKQMACEFSLVIPELNMSSNDISSEKGNIEAESFSVFSSFASKTENSSERRITRVTLAELIDKKQKKGLPIYHNESVVTYSSVLSSSKHNKDRREEASLKSAISINKATYRQIIGLDCEWNSLDFDRTTVTADIFQISTPETVFLIDLYTIFHPSSSASSSSSSSTSFESAQSLQQTCLLIIEKIFLDPTILKLGFEFHREDIDKLGNLSNGLYRNSFTSINSFCDIAREEISLKTNKPTSLKTRNKTSLSTLCEKYLGKSLNKSHRMTNWSIRPLGEEQVHYAALDAHCLIGIFDAMLLEKGINLQLNIKNKLYSSRNVK